MHRLSQQGTGFGSSLVDHGRSSSDAMLPISNFVTPNQTINIASVTRKHIALPMQTDVQQTPQFG